MKEKGEMEGDPLAFALVLTDRIQGAGRQVSALVDVAEKYIEAGKKDKGLEILSKALHITDTTTDPNISREQALIRIAEVYAIAEDFGQANRVVTTIGPDTNIYLATGYAAIAKAAAKSGNLDKAVSVAQTTKDNETFFEIVQIAATMGHVNQALQIAQAMDDTNSPGPKSRALRIIAEKYAETSQFDQAVQVVETIGDPFERARTILAIAGQHNRIGQFEKAQQLVIGSLKIAETLQEPTRSNLLLEVIQKSAEARHFDQAIQIAETIENAVQKAFAFADIAGLYAAAGRFEQATATAERINEISMELSTISGNPKETAFFNIARKYAEMGQMDQAKEISARLKDGFKDGILEEIGKSYARAGHFDLANEVIGTIEDDGWKASALLEISRNYAKAEQKEKVQEPLARAIQIAMKNWAIEYKSLSYICEDIVRSYAKGGEYSLALYVAMIIKNVDASIQIRSLSDIGGQLLRSRKQLDNESRKIMYGIIASYE